MSSRTSPLVAGALLALCVLGGVATVVAGAPATAGGQSVPVAGDPSRNGTADLAAIYPDPVAHRDAGEFVVVEASEPTSLAEFTLADDHRTVELPNATVDGRVVLSTSPALTRNVTDGVGPVERLSRGVRLANDGDRIRLRRNGTVVDEIGYANPSEGELGVARGEGVEWRPLGATDFPVVAADGRNGTVRTFVLPDGPSVPVETLRDADERILLAGYTLTSDRVADELVTASDRGVEVAVLVDGRPVGGITSRQARVLDRLVAADVSVTVLGGDRARYRYHHAKYAVVDDRALVTTENWKPSGTGGRSSRGWGAVVGQAPIVDALVATFEADTGWEDGIPWRRYRDGRQFQGADPPANGTYPVRYPPDVRRVERVELLRAPDNAERRVLDLVGSANRSVAVQQVSVGGRNQPFLRAALDAARRGVEVRILLGGAWYVEEENERLAAWLNERAAREGLPLEAKVANPQGRYGKIHAKGVVVDGERVLLGSLNWNNNSARDNREVALLLHGESTAGYYLEVFEADWRGGIWTLPIGLLVSVGIAVALAGLLGRRVAFERGGPPPGGRFQP